MRAKLIFFFDNFFGCLRDKQGSLSLKKLMAIGIFWVYTVTSVRFTTADNLLGVLGVHAGLISTLIIAHSYYKTKTNAELPGSDLDKQAGG